eukprot:20288-Heterococcus_DN1.PRE.1
MKSSESKRKVPEWLCPFLCVGEELSLRNRGGCYIGPRVRGPCGASGAEQSRTEKSIDCERTTRATMTIAALHVLHTEYCVDVGILPWTYAFLPRLILSFFLGAAAPLSSPEPPPALLLLLVLILLLAAASLAAASACSCLAAASARSSSVLNRSSCANSSAVTAADVASARGVSPVTFTTETAAPASSSSCTTAVRVLSEPSVPLAAQCSAVSPLVVRSATSACKLRMANGRQQAKTA